MSCGLKANRLLLALGAVLVFASGAQSALAQCSMCKAGVQAGASATRVAGTLNLAILVLLIPPVLIFCAIFIFAIRYRKTMDDGPSDALNARSF